MKPQLAKVAPDDLLALKRQGFVMEPKFDGDRAIITKVGSSVTVTTRTERDVSRNVPGIVDAMRRFPGDVTLDGELAVVARVFAYKGSPVPVVDFNATRSVMGSSPAEAVRKQRQVGQVVFIAFDCLSFAGESQMMQADSIRRARLFAACEWGIAAEAPMLLSPRWSDWLPSDAQALMDLGAEGAMLKRPSAPYVVGKRPENVWLKVKRRDTIDAVIDGFEPGKGKYTGLIGAIRLKVKQDGKWVDLTKVSGMDDATRVAMSRDFDAYRGRVVEVAYTGQVGPNLRHPRFVGFRDDKSPEECVI